MSASLMFDFELEYMKRLHCCGWNSAAVITSVSSSMFTGLMSTMSTNNTKKRERLRQHEITPSDNIRAARIAQGPLRAIWKRCGLAGRWSASKRPRTEAPITDVQIPEIYPEIVGGNECLLVGIDGDGMDVVGMGVGVDFAGYGGDDVVLNVHAR